MGYQVYEDFDHGRWAGYGVPAECDWSDCRVEIDRGVAFKCESGHVDPDDDGSDPEFTDYGCGLFFCTAHRYSVVDHDVDHVSAKPDSLEWESHILGDESWAEWREANPDRVDLMRRHLPTTSTTTAADHPHH